MGSVLSVTCGEDGHDQFGGGTRCQTQLCVIGLVQRVGNLRYRVAQPAYLLARCGGEPLRIGPQRRDDGIREGLEQDGRVVPVGSDTEVAPEPAGGAAVGRFGVDPAGYGERQREVDDEPNVCVEVPVQQPDQFPAPSGRRPFCGGQTQPIRVGGLRLQFREDTEQVLTHLGVRCLT